MTVAPGSTDKNIRPPVDKLARDIAEYVYEYVPGESALRAAKLCLADSVACALMALGHSNCARHLGPLAEGGEIPNGARVIGAKFALDPVKAAFDNGALIRWLDFNDTWLAAEWGHPSDNLGAIWAIGDWLSRRGEKGAPFVSDILSAMVKAHEIQGVLALANSFNRAGLDHVALVKIASAAVSAHLLGASREQAESALTHAFADGQALRVYRHAPNTTSRKSWAAGDAASRGLRLAMMAAKGEDAIPGALSAKRWGFCDVSFGGREIVLPRAFGSYVMENVLYKVSFPAEFHAQTAVECAFKLHSQVAPRLADVSRARIETQEPAVRIISKTGPLYNSADRDHCLQYMTAAALIFGELKAEHYEDETARDPRVDALREKMEVAENPEYSREYLDLEKRSVANSVQVFFKNGEKTAREEVRYPLGHARRREESLPFLRAKFEGALAGVFSPGRAGEITAFFDSGFSDFCARPMRDLAGLLAAEENKQ